MKAHPDFKWYKLPAPPARTLVTRPSNTRGNQIKNEKDGHISDNCGITLGKLVDDEQLGGLSSLINLSVPGKALTDSISIATSEMSQKGAESILKPPKKRYLINGEFQSHSDTSPVDNRDYQTRNACSALLELAEICTSSAVRESSSTILKSPERLDNTNHYASTLIENNKFTSSHSDSLVFSLPGAANAYKLKKTKDVLPPIVVSVDSSNNQRYDLQQDQPLDLCKNKDKSDFCKENSKTITTSHQQLIDHFVDKFLCDTPVPPNKFYKSEIIDPAFCKIFSEAKNNYTPSSQKEKFSHSAFTLSVAIESAVDKAYSKDSSKSHSSKFSESNVLLDCFKSDDQEFDIRLKMGDSEDHLKEAHPENIAKPLEQVSEKPSSSVFNNKNKKYLADSTSVDAFNNQSLICSQTSKESVNTDIPECSSSKYFCKLISPPKKSSVWCNIFMNEQMTKSSIESSTQIPNSLVSSFSAGRRSSQRTCKGRRYQALITEGLLQSPKERKQNNGKKTTPSINKIRNKTVVTENQTFTSTKKKKKKNGEKNKSAIEAYGLGTSLFNLEEKIASLPKCSFEHLNKKKKIILEPSINSIKQENVNALSSTSAADNSCTSSSDITDYPSVSSSGKYKTGNFDLEEEIASLPKCDIEILSKKKKKD